MPTTLLKAEVLLFLFAIVGLVGWKCLSGYIDCRRLIVDPASGLPSVGRGQLLLITILGGAGYLIGDLTHTESMPQIPEALIAAFGLSHAAYHLDAMTRKKSGPPN